MKNNIIKKIGLAFAAFFIVISVVGFTSPEKASAILGVGDIVFDLPDTLQNLLGQLSGVVTAAATDGQYIQVSVLNAVATAIAKQLLMQITESVINWINSGFNGNPAFVQNPSAFFQNIGDQATAQFVSQNSALSSLCSPFSVQVRLAIAQQQLQNDGYGTSDGTNQYSCTLSSAVGTNGSIQGFLGGDFSQGGWSAFATLVTQPQNTPNGAYLEAEDQIQQQIDAQATQKQNELNQGQGFLSWESCTSDNSVSATQAGNSSDPFGIAAENDPNQTCSIQTPGSAIAAALNKHLAVPSEELELANSITDVISVAFSEIIVNVLQSGLTSVSKPSSSGGASYLQSAVNSANQQSLATNRSGLMTTITPFLNNAQAIDQNYNQALAVVLAASTTIGQAESCYQTLLLATTSINYSLAAPYLQGQITNLQGIAASGITPVATTVIAKGASASTTANQYLTMYNQVVNAQTLSDLTTPSQTLTSLSQSGGLPTPANIQNSLTDLQNTQTSIAPVQQQAATALQQCRSFSFVNFTTSSNQ